jgi:hypothetical protein
MLGTNFYVSYHGHVEEKGTPQPSYYGIMSNCEQSLINCEQSLINYEQHVK